MKNVSLRILCMIVIGLMGLSAAQTAMGAIVTSPLLVTGTIGTEFRYQITSSPPANATTSTGLPAGLNLTTSTGLISGTLSTTGTSIVTLKINTAGGYTNADLVIVSVMPIPVITSPLTASGTSKRGFTYQVAATNSPTSFSATGLPAGLKIDPSTGLISGTADAAGSSYVTLGATNSGGTGTASLLLTITNLPVPKITSAVSATGTTGVGFNYQITATNQPTGYSSTALPAGLSLNASTGLISGTPSATGSVSVTIGASNDGGTGSSTLTMDIVPPRPVITSGLTAKGTAGVPFNYQITASNKPVRFDATGLPDGLSLDPATGLISGTTEWTGTTNVTLSATNAGGTGGANLEITILPRVPAITSGLSITGTTGVGFNYQVTASNQPGSYGVNGLPAGLSMDTATGLISGTALSTGTSSVVLFATNAGGTGSASLTLAIVPPVPVITSPLSATGTTGFAFRYQIAGSNNPTCFSATGLPAGLVLERTTGLISGTATSEGTSSVVIGARNAGGKGTAVLLITIGAPVPETKLAVTGTVGVAFQYSPAGMEGMSGFSASELPEGLVIDPATGIISGLPVRLGTTVVSISANSGSGAVAKATLVITIVPPRPAISSPLKISATTGQAFSYRIEASNAPTSFSVDELPEGLSLDSKTGVISGTATAVGTSLVVIGAVNAGGEATATLETTVVRPAPVITSRLTAIAISGTAFEYQIEASNDPVEFSAGNLPAGLGFDSNSGKIFGKPTQLGTSMVAIGAANTTGTACATLELEVVGAADLYVSNFNANTISKIAADGTVSTFVPAGAGLNEPTGLVWGMDGNLYVANARSATISKIAPDGSVMVKEFATGFSDPRGLAIDYNGNLYVANSLNGTISKVAANGAVSTFASGLKKPQGLAFDYSGNLYVANEGDGTIAKITLSGSLSTYCNGLSNPNGLAFDGKGTLFVAANNGDIGNNGDGSVLEIGGDGLAREFLPAGSGLNRPIGVAFDPSGNLHVANSGNNTISKTGRKVQKLSAELDTPTYLAFAPQQTRNGPEANTKVATSIAPTGARLNAIINPHGENTSVAFEYSTSSTLAQAINTGFMPVGNAAAVPAGATISGLAPDTRYYYRAIAMSPAGISRGKILSFLTPIFVLDSKPPTASINSAAYSNIDGRGTNLAIAYKGLNAGGTTTFAGVPATWLEGPLSGFSTATYRFTDKNGAAVALSGVRFRIEDAEIGEQLANFCYWDASGKQIALNWKSSVFRYSAAPMYSGSGSMVENGASLQSGSQDGKWIDIDLTGLQVSGFQFEMRRKNSGAGSIIMGQIGGQPVAFTLSGTYAPSVLFTRSNGMAWVPDYSGQAVVSRGATGEVTFTQSPAPGAEVGVGSIPVTITVVDSIGNTSATSFNIIALDRTAPTLAAPSNGFAPLSQSSCWPLPLQDYTRQVVVTDNVAVTRITQSPAPGTLLPIGTTAVVLNAYDAVGNCSSLSFNVEFKKTVASAGNPDYEVVANKGGAVPGVAGAFFSNLRNPAINDTGAVAYLGTWSNGHGIFAGINPRLVVGSGSPAPDTNGAIFATIADPVLNQGGVSAEGIAFAATLGKPVANGSIPGLTGATNAGLWNNVTGSLQLVARTGSEAPGTNGGVFKSFGCYSLIEDEMLFLGSLVASDSTATPAPGGVKASNAQGVWRWTDWGGTQLILRTGQTVPGESSPVKSFQILNLISKSPGQGRHHLGAGKYEARVTLLSGKVVNYFIDARGETPVLFQVAASGESFVGNLSLSGLGNPAGNGFGDAVFTATFAVQANANGTNEGVTSANNTAIVYSAQAEAQAQAGGCRVNDILARKGDALVGYPAWLTFSDPVVNNEGNVAWLSTLGVPLTSTNNTVLALSAAGEPTRIVAQTGKIAPESNGATFATIDSVAIPNGAKGPIFTATLVRGGMVTAANNSGLWGVDQTGAVRLLLRSGDLFSSKTIKSFAVLTSAGASPGQTRSFNAHGEIVASVTFTDGSQSLVVITIP